MPLYFHVPLPGPFSYGQRIGGKRKRKPEPQDPMDVGIVVVLVLIVTAVVLLPWWVLALVGIVGIVTALAVLGGAPR